jgi:L-lactate dehydrogenase (cytochrome)
MSIGSIEDVAAAVSKPFWFQLYVMRDRAFVADLIARARDARCAALVLTVDLQVLGKRHADVKFVRSPRDRARTPAACAPHGAQEA